VLYILWSGEGEGVGVNVCTYVGVGVRPIRFDMVVVLLALHPAAMEAAFIPIMMIELIWRRSV